MSEGIVWETPPQASRKGRSDRVAILRAVAQRPGEWARLGTWTSKATAQQAASDAKCGRTLKVDGGTFVSQWGPVEGQDGLYGVWVMFQCSNGQHPAE